MDEILKDVSKKDYFHVKDGRVLRNVEDLANVLGKIEPKVFAKHVKGEKNEFHEWVRDCLGNEQLAKGLERAGADSSKAFNVVDKWLSFTVKKHGLKLRSRKVVTKDNVVKKKLMKRRLKVVKERGKVEALSMKSILRVLKDG